MEITIEKIQNIVKQIIGYSGKDSILITMLTFFTIIFLTFFMKKMNNKLFDNYLRKKDVPETQLVFMKYSFSGLIYVVGAAFALSTLPNFKDISKSIFAGSSILAVTIGFASQHALANIIGGLFIAIFKPFRIGDLVKLVTKNITGVVEDITLRHTVIKNFENKRFVIPNSIISQEIIENASIIEEKVCRHFEIGISYDSDVDLAMKIIIEEALKHKNFLDNRSPEDITNGVSPIITRVISFGDSSVNLKAWIWAKDNSKGFEMGCDLNYSVKKRFDAEGITIPYPQRVVHLKNDK